MIRLFLLIAISTIALAQPKWNRAKPVQPKFTLFKSAQVLNLHSAETIPKGDLQYGISHRFNSPVSTGWSDLYGLDGGATMRMHLSYGITDELLVELGRTNQLKQLNLKAKYKFYQSADLLPIPIMMTIMGNLGFSEANNIQDLSKSTADKIVNIGGNDKFKYTLSLIINTMLFDRIGLGIKPTYLNDALIAHEDENYAVTLGYYLQYYIGDNMTSFIIEANPTIAGFRGTGRTDLYDTFTFGAEFETGGHFFKLMVSNNNVMNLTQLNQGSDLPLTLDNLRFGFQITRNFGL